MPKIMPQSTTDGVDVEVWTFEAPRCEQCCHKQAGPGKPRHCPVIMKTIIQLYVPRTPELNLTLGSDWDRDAGFLMANLKTDARKYWLLFPKVPSTMVWHWGIRWLNLLFVFLSPINDPGISRVTRLKEYRKCRTRLPCYCWCSQWIKVDERFIHGNLWLMAIELFTTSRCHNQLCLLLL